MDIFRTKFKHLKAEFGEYPAVVIIEEGAHLWTTMERLSKYRHIRRIILDPRHMTAEIERTEALAEEVLARNVVKSKQEPQP